MSMYKNPFVAVPQTDLLAKITIFLSPSRVNMYESYLKIFKTLLKLLKVYEELAVLAL